MSPYGVLDNGIGSGSGMDIRLDIDLISVCIKYLNNSDKTEQWLLRASDCCQ